MSNIKVIEGLEPWEVMKRASEGEAWAFKHQDNFWKESKGIKTLAGCISNAYPVAIIDTTTPEIDFNDPKWNWDFFNQYGGLKVTMREARGGYFNSVASMPTAAGIHELRESPFYYWPGSDEGAPVPDNVEVECVYRDNILFANRGGSISWQHSEHESSDIIAFKLLLLGVIAYGTTGSYLVNKDYLYTPECVSVPEVEQKGARF